MSQTSNHNSSNQIDQLYQQRKAQHKMPDTLKASLQNDMAKQLQVEARKTRHSRLLRHPAFALTFTLVLVIGVMLNDWTSVEQQFSPQLSAQHNRQPQSIIVSDIGKSATASKVRNENQTDNNEVQLRQKSQSISAATAPPVSADFSYSAEQAAQTNEKRDKQKVVLATELAAIERQSQRRLAEQIKQQTARNGAKQQLLVSDYNTSAVSTSRELNDQGADSQAVNIQGASSQEKTQKSIAPAKELTVAMPQIRLLIVKAINNKQLQLLSCQGQTHTLSLAALPNTKVGNKLVIKTLNGETLPANLDERSFEIIPVAAQTQCE